MKTLNTLALIVVGFVSTPLHSWAGMIMTLCVVEPSEIEAVQTNRAKLEVLLSGTNETRVIDIDKSWHGIHYLLTGTSERARGTRSLVIFGGKEFGGDMGYGPARLLSPAEVKEIAMLLKEETAEKLSTRYDPKKMAKLEIYPNIWVRDGKEALAYLIDYYKTLVIFYQRAAKAGQGVIIVLS